MINNRFNIKFISLITISLFFLSQKTFSQSPDWMSQREIDLLKGLKISYNKPNDFDEVIGNDCFENKPTLKKILNCGGNQLRSKDNRFVVFNKIVTLHTGSNNTELIDVFPAKGKSPYTWETFYMSYVKNDIRHSIGEDGVLNWKDHVNYYSINETVSKFNADTALSYSVHLEAKNYYKGKYNNLWVLVIKKKGRGFVRMYCFYEDMSKIKLAKYKTKVEGIFRYKD